MLGGIIAFITVSNTANANEYRLGNDKIKSVKAVVGKRQVTSVSTETSKGITTKKMEYKSDSVQDDLMEYTYYLRTDGEFNLTQNMDLTVVSSTIELSKNSVDDGKIIMMTIEYNPFGYIITIQKGEGTLTVY